MDEKVKILLFGILAEKSGITEMQCAKEKDSETLLTKLLMKYPALNNLKFSVAINKEIISENTTLQPNDEIALLPPFSGG